MLSSAAGGLVKKAIAEKRRAAMIVNNRAEENVPLMFRIWSRCGDFPSTSRDRKQIV